MKFVMAIVVALAACKGGGEHNSETTGKTIEQRLEADRAKAVADRVALDHKLAADRAAAMAKAKAVVALAAPAGAADPEALWEAYRAAHHGATSANAIETGKKIWPLLGKEARKIVSDSVDELVARLSVKLPLTREELTYKLVGESAAARGATIADHEPSAFQERPNTVFSDGSIHGSCWWEVRDGQRDLRYEAESENGIWTLAPSKDLIVSDTEIFKAPAGTEAPAGEATADAAVERWKQVMESGTGWDAYNLMSPAMRTRLQGLVAQMGGSGPGDVAKIFEKTIVDRRNRGIHVKSTSLDDKTDSSASVAFTYSDGTTDRFRATRTDGVWWIEMEM